MSLKDNLIQESKNNSSKASISPDSLPPDIGSEGAPKNFTKYSHSKTNYIASAKYNEQSNDENLEPSAVSANGDGLILTPQLKLAVKRARLLRAKTLFKSIQKHGIGPLITGLNDDDIQVSIAALNVAKHVVTFKGVTNAKVVKEMIQINKQLFHNAKGFSALGSILKKHSQINGSVAILKSVLELFSSVLCSETNTLQYEIVREIMELLKPNISSLLRMTCSNNTVLAYHSTVIVQCLLLHTDEGTHNKIQRSALRTGCFLKHLYISVKGTADFDEENLPQLSGECESRIQHESRMLVGLLIDGFPDASDSITNILPSQLISENINVHHKFEYRFDFLNINSNRDYYESTAYHQYSSRILYREN